MLRDLFQSDDGGWLQDVGLLDRLVAEKLRVEADRIATEGWKWVEASLSIPYGVTHAMRELIGTPLDMTEEEQGTRAGLQAELDRLTDQYEDADELPDEVDQRLGEIEAALEALDNRPMRYDPAEIANAGVFVTIDSDGSLIAERGYVRPEDEAPIASDRDDDVTDEIGHSEPTLAQAIRPVVVTVGGQPALGTATEMKAMRNYAGHRLSPWLGHLMVSRSETARPLLTPGEIMQLPPADEIVMVAGIPPIRARKARYFEDARFKERILPPPALAVPKQVQADDWTGLAVPPQIVSVSASPVASGDDDDPTDSERRQQPELSLAQPIENRQPVLNEFEIDSDHNDDGDELAARNQRLSGIMQGVARQASLDFDDGMEI